MALSSDTSCLAFSSFGPGPYVIWYLFHFGMHCALFKKHDMYSICVALNGAYNNARTYRFNCTLLSFGNDQVIELFVQL